MAASVLIMNFRHTLLAIILFSRTCRTGAFVKQGKMIFLHGMEYSVKSVKFTFHNVTL